MEEKNAFVQLMSGLQETGLAAYMGLGDFQNVETAGWISLAGIVIFCMGLVFSGFFTVWATILMVTNKNFRWKLLFKILGAFYIPGTVFIILGTILHTLS